jgi:hypothetical protein
LFWAALHEISVGVFGFLADCLAVALITLW